MIASERNLPSAHQPQAPQRRQPSVTKSKNGITKPPIRPVKVYVLDPKTLQQRLEAYVGQKNKKEAERERERESESKNEKVPTSSIPTTTVAPSTSTPYAKTKTTSSKPPVPKLLSIALKNSPVTTQNQTATLTTGGTGSENGVTLQCITTSSFGLPSVPVVVTNGVGLLQTPISQSSIQAGGLFLSGITTISSATTQGNREQATTLKRKAKKRKTAKKKKLTKVDKEKEDNDESELEYLRKETTTRLGRISRPISRPRSPTFSTAANSRVPSPKRKKASQTSVQAIELRCETCFQVYQSQEQINIHLKECLKDKITQEKSCPQSITSTNDQITAPASVPIPVPTSTADPQANSVTISSTLTSTSLATTVNPKNRSASTIQELGEQLRKSTENSYNLTVTGNATTAAGTPNSLVLNLRPTYKDFPESVNKSNANSQANINSDNNVLRINCSKLSTNLETNLNEDLVPNKEEPNGLFQRRTATSNVGLVPSSYSIPCSPPSQCHSPGFPDNIHSSMAKEGTNSPERTCHSPVDPMLLRSRSPFPPPVVETSHHSVSVSNFSIPEESLCKGELFMDLTEEGILGRTGIGRISPFCESASERLFANSPMMKPVSQLMDEASVPDIDLNVESEAERKPSSSSSPRVAPILTTEDANDGEIFQNANYARNFVHPSVISNGSQETAAQRTGSIGVGVTNSYNDFPKTPQSSYMDTDVSMDSSEVAPWTKKRSIWQFVKEQIKSCGISQTFRELSEMADKLSRISSKQFCHITEEEIERFENSSYPIIQVDTFIANMLELKEGAYAVIEGAGQNKNTPPSPPLTSSELSITGGVDDVEKFLPSNIDLIALPHLTNLDLS